MARRGQKRHKKKFDDIDRFETKRKRNLKKLNKKSHNYKNEYYDDYSKYDDRRLIEEQEILEQKEGIEQEDTDDTQLQESEE
jgi:hypothetical protein